MTDRGEMISNCDLVFQKLWIYQMRLINISLL